MDVTEQDISADDTAPDGSDDPAAAATPSDELDLAAIEADLDDVQAALARLADDSYWTDEVTGEPIPTEVLAATPLTRRT